MTDCIQPIAEKSRLGFASFHLDAEGLLGNEDGIWRFTEIKFRPVVTIPKDEDRDRAIRLLEKAKELCLIARSLEFKVALLSVVKVETESFVLARVSRSRRPSRGDATRECHVNDAKWCEKANKKRKEKENPTNPI